MERNDSPRIEYGTPARRFRLSRCHGVILVALALTVAIGAAVRWSLPAPRREAVVTNLGTTPMRDVGVAVTGRTYPLGDLSAKETRALGIDPTGESHIVLTYVDEGGRPQSLLVDCYLEPRDSVTIAVDVKDGKVVRVQERRD